jgi:hypothetical protein
MESAALHLSRERLTAAGNQLKALKRKSFAAWRALYGTYIAASSIQTGIEMGLFKAGQFMQGNGLAGTVVAESAGQITSVVLPKHFAGVEALESRIACVADRIDQGAMADEALAACPMTVDILSMTPATRAKVRVAGALGGIALGLGITLYSISKLPKKEGSNHAQAETQEESQEGA